MASFNVYSTILKPYRHASDSVRFADEVQLRMMGMSFILWVFGQKLRY